MSGDARRTRGLLRDGDVVIKGLTPYLIAGDLGIRQEPHQLSQPRTIPVEKLEFLVLDAGLYVFRDGVGVGRASGRQLDDLLEVLTRKIADEKRRSL